MSYSLAFAQAIAVIGYVAVKVEHGVYEFVPTKDIAQAVNLAGPTAVKLLQNLSRAGIIETREGAKGGVRLINAPHSITLFDIFHAIEQDRPLFRTDLKLRIAPGLADHAAQRVRTALDRAEEAMKAELRAVTIADLML
jgi:Rrf2 family protein